MTLGCSKTNTQKKEKIPESSVLPERRRNFSGHVSVLLVSAGYDFDIANWDPLIRITIRIFVPQIIVHDPPFWDPHSDKVLRN